MYVMTCIIIHKCFYHSRLILLIIISLVFENYVFAKNDYHSHTFLNFVQKDRDVCRGDEGDVWPRNKHHPSNIIYADKRIQINLHRSNHYYENDYLGYEAISRLHSLIDDDHDGDLDRSESQEFMEEDLKRDVLSLGATHYHHNNDLVSVDELWNYWIESEVYNWTVAEVVAWLEGQVELAQYSANFKAHDVNGKLLPRLASSLHSPLYASIGIRNVLHRQKIALKATDLVLFGTTKVQHRYFPDAIFFLSLMLAVLSCMVAVKQKKHSNLLLSNLNSELSLLQGVQHNLDIFQAQLEESQKRRREEEEARDELKKKLEKRKSIFRISGFDSDKDDDDDDDDGTDNDVAAADGADNDTQLVRNKRRFVVLSKKLKKETLKLFEAERKLEERKRQSTTPELQQWFQMTYEVETKYWREKKAVVEKNLSMAIKRCEKLKKQRFKFLSPIKEEPDDGAALFAKEMEGLRAEMKERSERWSMIERLTSLNIVTNPGIPYLNSLLRSSVADKMSSKNLLAMDFQGHTDSYPIKSNLLRAGLQLSAIGVSPRRAFTGSTDQQNQFFPSYPLITPSPPNNDNNYPYIYQNPLNNTNTSFLSSNSNSYSSFKSIPYSAFYPSVFRGSCTPPRNLNTPLTFESPNRLVKHSPARGFSHSKTLSDFLLLSRHNSNHGNLHYSSNDLSNANKNTRCRNGDDGGAVIKNDSKVGFEDGMAINDGREDRDGGGSIKGCKLDENNNKTLVGDVSDEQAGTEGASDDPSHVVCVTSQESDVTMLKRRSRESEKGDEDNGERVGQDDGGSGGGSSGSGGRSDGESKGRDFSQCLSAQAKVKKKRILSGLFKKK